MKISLQKKRQTPSRLDLESAFYYDAGNQSHWGEGLLHLNVLGGLSLFLRCQLRNLNLKNTIGNLG